MRSQMRNPAVGDRRARGTQLQNDTSDFTFPPQRLQVLAQHLHRLGPRATFELLSELIAEHGTDVVARLERYRDLDPALLRAIGGDKFPPSLCTVPR